MAKGYEGFLSIHPETDGWLGTQSLVRGCMLYADSETLSINQDIKDFPQKITYGRALKASSRTIGEQLPGGELTFQFRSDDLPPILLSHFQKHIGTAFGGSGTLVGSCMYTFVPEKGVPDYYGSAWGTGGYTAGKGNVFTFSVLKKYFDTTQNGGSNAIWFKSCIADELQFTLQAGEDAKLKVGIKAGAFTVGTVVGSLFNPDSSLGSYSSNKSFQWWSGTLTYGGGTLNVTKMDFTSKNGLTPYKAIGSLNPARYDWGRFMAEGSFDLDMPYDALKHWGTMIGGSSFAVVATLYNGTSDWVAFNFPNCRLKDLKADLKGGDTETTFVLPFTAYEDETGTTSPITVTVMTTTYGSTPVTRI